MIIIEKLENGNLKCDKGDGFVAYSLQNSRGNENYNTSYLTIEKVKDRWEYQIKSGNLVIYRKTKCIKMGSGGLQQRLIKILDQDPERKIGENIIIRISIDSSIEKGVKVERWDEKENQPYKAQ